MGTSKGIPTPKGGTWTPVKKLITDTLSNVSASSVNRIIGGVVSAAGGLGSSKGDSTSGGSRGTGRGGGGGGGGVGGTITGLAGFGADIRSGGLDAAATRLGLTDLRGRTAVEAVARIAEHLSQSVDGPQADLLAMALRDALLECAAVEADGSYDDLDNALQSYLDREGLEGLVESFLSRFVFDRVWAWIETHSQEKSDSVNEKQALESAVERACREHVQSLMEDVKTEGVFETTDWFGAKGASLGGQIVSTLEFRLESLHSESE
jgi:hypothetical protein